MRENVPHFKCMSHYEEIYEILKIFKIGLDREEGLVHCEGGLVIKIIIYLVNRKST